MSRAGDESIAARLDGARVLVTRAAQDQAALADQVRARGGVPIAFPCIEFAPPEDAMSLDAALDRLLRDPPAALALSSPHAIEIFGAGLRARGIDPSAALAEVLIGVAGEGSARALAAEGVEAVSPADGAGAEPLARALIEGLRARTLPFAASKRVLVPQAAEANPALVASLIEAGLEVEAVALYRTVPLAAPTSAHDKGLAALRAKEIDLILFASGSAVRGFVQLAAAHFAELSAGEGSSIISAPRIICIGATCASTARSLGLEVAGKGEGGFDSLLDAAAACYCSIRSGTSGERAP